MSSFVIIWHIIPLIPYVILLERNGFCVMEEEMINRDTLSMIVRKVSKFTQAHPKFCPVDVSGLNASRDRIQQQVDDLVDSLHQKGKTIAIWGASHQGFTLAATTRLGAKVAYIIDSAPFKQGLFAPTSHLPILSPDDALRNPVDAILIVAPGYTEEIAQIIRARFGSDTFHLYAAQQPYWRRYNRYGSYCNIRGHRLSGST